MSQKWIFSKSYQQFFVLFEKTKILDFTRTEFTHKTFKKSCKGLAYRDHWNNKTDTFGNLSLNIKISSVRSSFLVRSDSEKERETELIVLEKIKGWLPYSGEFIGENGNWELSLPVC